MGKRTLGRYTVETSREEKILFPESEVSKGDLIDYYQRIADVMLPHMEGRPLMMHRFPDGIAEEGFYQKDLDDYFPDWITRARVEKEGGGSVEHAVCDKTATLVYLADQGCITPHLWLSRRDRLQHPDRLIFDFDPPDDDFAPVRQAARDLHGLLAEFDMSSFVMTTGSRGLHVVVPLDRSAAFPAVREFARAVAEALADERPDAYTTEQYKEKRGERLFIDIARNAYAQTAVAPYAVRARKKAPVATPLDWSELDQSGLGPQSFTIANIFRRLGQKDDPWQDIDRHACGIANASQSLQEMLGTAK